MGFLDQVMRLPFSRGLWSRFPIGSVERKVQFGIYPRPNYAYGVYWSAVLAQRLGHRRIAAIELGVAGGAGLMALEGICHEIGRHVGVEILVAGFDSGKGMPAPVDYRDLPHIWGEGFYEMDEGALRSRLDRAELVLGDVAQTVPEWLEDESRPPIGFVAFDLDFYSSTAQALTLFDGPDRTHLPRVQCYFDDVACTDLGCMNTYVGEYLAIEEFNAAHEDRKVCKNEQLRANRGTYEIWQERMYAFHNFSHPDYCRLVIPRDDEHSQLRLDD